MEEKNAVAIPPQLIALDFVGALLVGLGLAKHFANVDVLPAGLLFENYALVFIVIGGAMMLPMVLHILNLTSETNEGQKL